jgi:hypothetical protein
MEMKLRLFADPVERWSALLLAAVVTLLLFAAIDAGFTVHGTDPAKMASALRGGTALDSRI